MVYIDNEQCKELLSDKDECLLAIRDAINVKKRGEYNQPIKPYLKFPDKRNRIIAMPAYVGGNKNICGIKWISSFPDNLEKNIPRAHCLTILNSVFTGIPFCIINASCISIIRTAALSTVLLDKYIQLTDKKKYVLGIIGYGPIGKMHKEYFCHLLKDQISEIHIYDKNIMEEQSDVIFETSWEEVYNQADILVLATNTVKPYLTEAPRLNCLTLNISLRDFCVDSFDLTNTVTVVDDWEEVNREKTNIYHLSRNNKLIREDTINIEEFLDMKVPKGENRAYFVNTMGMALFDICMGNLAYEIYMRKLRNERTLNKNTIDTN